MITSVRLDDTLSAVFFLWNRGRSYLDFLTLCHIYWCLPLRSDKRHFFFRTFCLNPFTAVCNNSRIRSVSPYFLPAVFPDSVSFSYTCSCWNIHIYAGYIPTQWTTDAVINDAGRLLYQYLPLTLLQGFEKVYVGFYCERELETEHKL